MQPSSGMRTDHHGKGVVVARSLEERPAGIPHRETRFGGHALPPKPLGVSRKLLPVGLVAGPSRAHLLGELELHPPGLVAVPADVHEAYARLPGTGELTGLFYHRAGDVGKVDWHEDPLLNHGRLTFWFVRQVYHGPAPPQKRREEQEEQGGDFNK